MRLSDIIFPSTRFDDSLTMYWPGRNNYNIRTIFSAPVNHDNTLFTEQLLQVDYEFDPKEYCLTIPDPPSVLELSKIFYEHGSPLSQALIEGYAYSNFLNETVNLENLALVGERIMGKKKVYFFPQPTLTLNG